MLTENTIFLAQPLHLSLSLCFSQRVEHTAHVTILLRNYPCFVLTGALSRRCVAPLYITHYSSTRFSCSPLALPNLGNRVETLRRPFSAPR